MVVLLSALVLTGACRGSGPDSAARSPTTVVPTSVEAPTTTGQPTTIATVPGPPRTTTTLTGALGPGGAQVAGVVNGPEGPVPGATVRVERLFGDEVDGTTIKADGSGHWALRAINGGRYRLRAWRPPDLVALQPTLVFLGATESATITLGVERHGPDEINARISPDPPVRDQPAVLVVLVANGQVDAEGVLRIAPRPGVAVQLAPGPGLALESPDVAVTDGAGNAAFAVRCTVAGAPPTATTVIAGANRTLALPPCAAPRR